MAVILLCLTLSLHILCNNGYEKWDQEFEHSAYLDSIDEYRVYWNVLNDTHIEFGLEVESIGWIGIGLSTNGRMINSDIIIGWIENDENNTIILQNRYTLNEQTTPILMDDQNNIQLIEGFQINNFTYLHFIRLLHPCNENSIKIPHGTAKVIYAYNKYNKPINNEPLYHAHYRGNKAINLLQGETFEVEMPSDVQIFDIKISNYSLPSLDTIYYCKLFKLPETINNEINHIIRIDPIIENGNEGIVHHMLLNYCPEAFLSEQDLANITKIEGICNQFANMGFSGGSCLGSSMVNAWAVGGHSFYFPEHVGFPFGGNKSDAMKYVLLNMHYDNPEKLDTWVDSSGMRIYYTSQLREHSAGSLLVGIGASRETIFIPPGVKSSMISGYCLHECLNEDIMGNNGITIFANLLHTHTAGISMKIRHIRNNTELKYIDVNEQYDFDYQQLWILPNEINLLPNDRLIMECTYNTENRINMTFGGEATYEEMCISYLYIYPKIELVWCTTEFLDETLYDFWNTAKQLGYATGNISDNYIDFNDVFYNVSYSEDALNYYNSLHKNTNLRWQKCRNDLLQGLNSDIVETQFEFNEYKIIDVCDEKTSSSNRFNWNSWYGNMIIIVASVTLLICCILLVEKIIKKRNPLSIYQKLDMKLFATK